MGNINRTLNINREVGREVSPKTGERYILLDETKLVKKYRVGIPTKTHSVGNRSKYKYVYLGYYKTLEDAVAVRDKYLSTY